MDMKGETERYLEGYHRAREEGERIGLDVLLGIEFRNFESDNDDLVVGITEDFIYEYPETYNLPLGQAIDLFHANEMLVIQAHPVRFGTNGYGQRKRICWLQCEEKLDGIEVYNGNLGWGQGRQRVFRRCFVSVSAADHKKTGRKELSDADVSAD